MDEPSIGPCSARCRRKIPVAWGSGSSYDPRMVSKFASVLCVVALFGLLGCGQRENAQQAAPAEQARVAETPPPETVTVPTDTASVSAETPAETTETPSSAQATTPSETPAQNSPPAPTPAPVEAPPNPAEVLTPKTPQTEPVMTPPPPPPSETQESPAASVHDPGGTVEVEATKAGLTHIGTAKCKMCHKLQFTSWSATAHAKRTPPLECENCHGAGSEYKAISVMKDPEKAKAAGLVIPGREFCGTCHQGEVSDEMLERVHAHKAKTTSP